MIAACAHPYARLGSDVLGRQPLRWIGQRSYGIYLWHWPVYMVTRPQLDVPIEGLPLLALRVGITLVLAELSYRYVETPIRRGALGRAWRELRESEGVRRKQLSLAWVGAGVSILAVCVALGVAASQAEKPEPPYYLASGDAIHTKAPTPKGPAPDVKNAAATPAVQSTNLDRRANPRIEAPEEKPARDKPDNKKLAAGADPGGRVGSVSAVGDSVMLGSAVRLQKAVPNLTTIDAEVGFQAVSAIDVLAARRASGELGEVVVVHIGSNGVYTEEQFDQTMQVLKGVRRVVFVNVSVPRTWAEPNNEVIAEGVERYPDRAVLVDWYAASVDHPEYFVEDGVHLQIEGQKVYAALIAEQVEAK